LRDKVTSEVLSTTDAKMRKTIAALNRELSTMRTGRATPALVDNIKVDYYGVPTPISQIATISAPEARLVVIQPWERSTLASIEKAILKSELGFNPTNDGNVIRLVIPPLTQERRLELVKVVRRRAEEGKIALRNLRREAVEELRKIEKEKRISHDEYERGLAQLQKLIDSFTEEVDRIVRDKEAEVMEV